MAILQALELLLIRNYIPQRSFFIALGHDEEVSGTRGALKISELLQARGIQVAFLVDECSFIFDGFIPNLKKPCAMVSVTEKGALDLLLQVNMTPGHSSAPPKETSIGILAAAVSRLENTPMPNMFGSGPLKMTLEQLANEFPFPTNIVLKNLWLFRPLVSRLMERNYITNTLVRTTTALTMFNAGVKVNVIPPVAQASVNFRIHPAQTVHEVLELVKNIVADDRVQLHVLRAFDPLPISPSDDKALGYQLLRQTIQSIFPEVDIVAPGICIANTDSRHYTNITAGIYHFNPVYLQPQDFSSIHGINEKISVQAYETQVKFIFELIQNADTYTGPVPHVHEL
jgi:carboxypeptidase PM20D1